MGGLTAGKLRGQWAQAVARLFRRPPAHLAVTPQSRQDADAFATELIAALGTSQRAVLAAKVPGTGVADEVLAGAIRLRTGDAIALGPGFTVDWQAAFPSKATSNLLFFYSLEYVAALLHAHAARSDPRYLEAAAGIVRSFVDFIDAAPGNRAAVLQLRGSRSNDHATSKRTLVLLQVVDMLVRQGHDPALARRVAALLHAHAVYLQDNAHYVENNHGVMADLALAELGTAMAGSPQGQACIARAVARLTAAVQRIFDADGYAFENTVGYHRFNLNLFRTAVERCEEWGTGAEFVRVARPILERASEALRHCVWPDGSIPPIGDSPIFARAAVSIDRSRLFAQSHFGVIKSPELYLSFICGRRGKAHKHVDDTSVTLRYAGQDILIDAGSYNYDASDPYRQCVSSSFGHSGIFPCALDGASRQDYHRMKVEARIDDWREDADGVAASGEVYFRQWGARVRRRITVQWPARVVIEDTVTLDAGREPAAFRQGWLLGKDVVIASDRHEGETRVLELTAGKVRATVRFSGSGGELRAATHTGVKELPYRGWYSEAKGQVAPTTELALYRTGRSLAFRAAFDLARA